MRLLWGPSPVYANAKGLHEIVEFGTHGTKFEDGETWDDLFDRLPHGFKPDAVVWRFADTRAWPILTPCSKPLIAILSDWSLYFTVLQGVLNSLLGLLGELDLSSSLGRPKHWRELGKGELHYRHGNWLAFAGRPMALGRDELIRAIGEDPLNPEYWNATAVVESIIASKTESQEERLRIFKTLAEPHWLNLLEKWPGYVLGQVNLGLARLEFGFRERGVETLTKALEWLASESIDLIVRGGCFFYVESDLRNSTDFTMIRVEWERLIASCGADEARLIQELRSFLFWQCARRLGDNGLA